MTRSQHMVLSPSVTRSGSLVHSRTVTRSTLLVLSSYMTRSRTLVLSQLMTRSTSMGCSCGVAGCGTTLPSPAVFVLLCAYYRPRATFARCHTYACRFAKAAYDDQEKSLCN